MSVVHGPSNHAESEEYVLKSPLAPTMGLQPENDAFSSPGAAYPATNEQTIEGATAPDNLSDVGDSRTSIEAGGCESDNFDSVYVKIPCVYSCQLTSQNSDVVEEDPSTQVMLPSMQDNELVPLYHGLPELGYVLHFS
jgi:hypothetical protein